MKKTLENNLNTHLSKNLPPHLMKEEYLYSVLPAGKLFRPLLAQASFEDLWSNSQECLNNPNHPLSLLCSALEIHHAYTLVHDDLPCMDDDDYRRGRESTHKKFGEWQALLAGDGLLEISLQLIQPLNFPTRRFFSWATGPRGLIFGQYMDLSQDAVKSFENMLMIHKLKTARLIQTSILGGYLVNLPSFEQKHMNTAKSLFRLGHALGISFQLIDDITELTEEDIGQHEKTINPWINHYQKSLDELQRQLKVIEQSKQYHSLTAVIDQYLGLMKNKINDRRSMIEKNMGNNVPQYLLS